MNENENRITWGRAVRGSFGVDAHDHDRSRLLENCQVVGTCWLWRGPVRNGAGGTMTVGGKSLNVQRLAYAMLIGVAPRRTRVSSSCGNPTCCCPDHLRVSGTVKH